MKKPEHLVLICSQVGSTRIPQEQALSLSLGEHASHPFKARACPSWLRLLFHKLLLHLASVFSCRDCRLRDAALLTYAHSLDVPQEIQDQFSLLPLLHTLAHKEINAFVYRLLLDTRKTEQDLFRCASHGRVIKKNRCNQ